MKAQMFNHSEWIEETNPYELRKKIQYNIKRKWIWCSIFCRIHF